MENYNLQNFTGGWFIGDFTPSLLQTNQFEAACKYYNKGDTEKSHCHKIATEYTIIAAGSVQMNGMIFKQNDIIKIDKGEYTDFMALEDTITFVVKTPSIKNDKFVN